VKVPPLGRVAFPREEKKLGCEQVRDVTFILDRYPIPRNAS
jgi:hypothetical protein